MSRKSDINYIMSDENYKQENETSDFYINKCQFTYDEDAFQLFLYIFREKNMDRINWIFLLKFNTFLTTKKKSFERKL